jgi:hypothetical protein
MANKTTIKLKDLKKVLGEMPKDKIELNNNSWGDVRIHYKEVVEVNSIMYHVNNYLNNV